MLRRTGESVYLSPEGKRITDGTIGHFNKGAFHLATNLQVPILPFYIDIPPEIDPQMGRLREELERMADICLRRDLLICSDEAAWSTRTS